MLRTRTMNNRLLYIDSLRGFAILLVIVGHLIQYNYKSSLENPIFNIIYSFHMPLFFFISGVSTAISKRKDNITIFKYTTRKFKSLILPSITWTLLVPLFFQSQFIYDNSISAYWFLNVLFCIHILDEIITRCSKFLGNGYIKPILVALLVSICFIIDFKRIPVWYFLIYMLGYYFQYYKIGNKLNGYVVSIAVLVFLLLVGYYNYGETTAGNPERIWMMMPLSLLASISLIYLFLHLPDRMNEWMSVIGRRTLAIYLCHFVFVSIPFVDMLETSFTTLTQFVILMGIALIISYLCLCIQTILGCFPLLNLLLYGREDKKSKA